MGRITDNLKDVFPAIEENVKNLGSNNELEKVKALESINDVFAQNSLSWDDVALVLKHFPKYYEEATAKAKSEPPNKPNYGTLQEGEWRRAKTGSLRGMLNGNSCTVFPSKNDDGTFCTIINIAGEEKPRWKYDFETENEAVEYLVENYGPR